MSSLLRAFALRASLLYVVALPVYTFTLGWPIPGRPAILRAFAWVHVHAFQPLGLDLTPWLVFDVAVKLELVAAAALLWVLLDRRRRHEAVLREAISFTGRYVVGVVMIAFGLGKVIPLQFSAPGPVDLIEPIGESIAMTSAWGMTGHLLGASIPYQMFTGWVEVAGGALLFSRRTTPPGLVVLLIQLSAVFAMTSETVSPLGVRMLHFNWHAMVVLLGVLILLALWWRPVLYLVGLHDSAPAVTSWRGLQRLEVAARMLALVVIAYDARALLDEWRFRQNVPALDGLYRVERMEPSGGDPSTRWRVVALESCKQLVARTVAGRSVEYAVVNPTSTRRACPSARATPHGTLALRGPAATSDLRYALDGHVLRLTGELDGTSTHLELRRITDGR